MTELLNNAGSASFSPKKLSGMSHFEYLNLCHSLATIESDGDDDKEEWNLINEFALLKFNDLEDLEKAGSLSLMLILWHNAQVR